MHIKKATALFAAAILTVLAGCGQDAPEHEPVASEPPPSSASEVTPVIPVEAVESAVPEVVATVGEEPITGEEFRKAMEQSSRAPGALGAKEPMSDTDQRMLLDNLIDHKVLVALAGRADVVVAEDEVESALEEQKARMPSQDMFAGLLAQMGMTEEDLKDRLREGLTVRKYVDEATKDLTAAEEELAEQYETLKGEGKLDRAQETVDVSHILVKVEGEEEAAWDAGKTEIDAARARVAGGEAFGDVAKEVSDDPGSATRGGAYPETAPGRMVPEFDKQMLSTPVGEVSEPFRTQYGWHILTVTGKHAPGTMTREEVDDRLKQYVMNQKKKVAIDKLIADGRAEVGVKVLYLADLPEEGATSQQP